jgi:selenide, water dikinase
VTGLVRPEELLTNATAMPGDVLVLSKPLGTGFITTANKKGECPAEVLDAAVQSMILLNAIGRDAVRESGGVHSMTDVTGFGLAGHASEMAEAAGVTIQLNAASLPRFAGIGPLVNPRFHTRASKSNREFLAGRIVLNEEAEPEGVELAFDAQTSGGLLIAVAPSHAQSLLEALRSRDATAAVVGIAKPRIRPIAIEIH